MKIRLHALAVLALACPAFGSTTWYVDVAGTPPGSGTLADPYTSIQYAINQATTVSGDTLLVLPGTYVGQVSVNKNLNIQSAGGPLVTFLEQTAAATLVVMSGSTSNVLLEGFTLRPAPDQIGVFCGSSNRFGHRVERCILEGQGGSGIFAHCDARFTQCTIVGFDEGVFVQGGGCGEINAVRCALWNNGVGLHQGGLNIGEMYWCVGNLSTHSPNDEVGCVPGNPGLWDVDGGDYHPAPGSPCIPLDAGALAYDPAYVPPTTTYCVAKMNSQGCLPAISATGQASATSPTPFLISADFVVDHKTGRLLYGFSAAEIPFQGGTLCLASFRRTEAQNSGGSGACAGHFEYDMNARIQSGIDPGLVAGRVVYGQYWYRDPLDPSGFTIGLSNAIRFGIAP